MEGFLPDPVVTFLNGARNIGVSPSRRRRYAQRYQAWKERQTKTNNTPSPVEVKKVLKRQVRDPKHNKPTRAQQNHPKRPPNFKQAIVGTASLHQDQSFPPLVSAISLDHKPPTFNSASQTERQVTVSREIQTSHHSLHSKYMQTPRSPVRSVTGVLGLKQWPKPAGELRPGQIMVCKTTKMW